MADKIIGVFVGSSVVRVDPSTPQVIENPREWLEANYVNKHVDLSYGFCWLLGYRYDFRPFMKRFVYSYYDRWECALAPNKTLLRKAVGAGIGEVHEIPKK